MIVETIEDEIFIKGIDFISSNILLIKLSNDRTLFVPLNKFKEIETLSETERADFEIIDGKYLSFISISEIYSLQELAGF